METQATLKPRFKVLLDSGERLRLLEQACVNVHIFIAPTLAANEARRDLEAFQLPPASEDDVVHYGSAGRDSRDMRFGLRILSVRRGQARTLIGEMKVMAKNYVVAVDGAFSVAPFH